MNKYTNAKIIFDFYMNKLQEDTSVQGNLSAMQFANLKLLKLRTNSLLNSLYSYKIEVDK